MNDIKAPEDGYVVYFTVAGAAKNFTEFDVKDQISGILGIPSEALDGDVDAEVDSNDITGTIPLKTAVSNLTWVQHPSQWQAIVTVPASRLRRSERLTRNTTSASKKIVESVLAAARGVQENDGGPEDANAAGGTMAVTFMRQDIEDILAAISSAGLDSPSIDDNAEIADLLLTAARKEWDLSVG